MSYADGRVMLDADSHLMELPDFLSAHADPGMGERIPRVNFDSGGKLSKRLAVYGASRRHEPDVVDQLLGLGDQLLTGPKGYEALGGPTALAHDRPVDGERADAVARSHASILAGHPLP